jgi:restriction system protein
MSPRQFERFVAALFEHCGFEARHLGGPGDHGVDILLTRNGCRFAVQVKRYRQENRVGEPELRGFYGSLSHFRARYGFFVTTSTFTHAARAWARRKRRLHLIDGEELLRMAGEGHASQLLLAAPTVEQQGLFAA